MSDYFTKEERDWFKYVITLFNGRLVKVWDGGKIVYDEPLDNRVKRV